MSRILRRLQESKFVEFADLFDPREGIAELVVTFLAILELVRETLIEVNQQAAYASIYVRLRGSQLAVVE